MKTIVHVNTGTVKTNTIQGTDEPVIKIIRGDEFQMAHEVRIEGPSEVIYRPNDPLPTGTRCWIETEAEVTILR